MNLLNTLFAKKFDDLVVALNQETGQYIMYNNEPASDDLLLSSSAFARHPKLQIR